MSEGRAAGCARYALELCARIAACTDVPGGMTRLFLSPATRRVHALLRVEMEVLGMSVRVDAAGNLRGLYCGDAGGMQVLLTGSHIDTVPDGGAFDGVLGVAIPLACLRALEGRRLPFAVEVIAFSEEEGVRFRMPFIGSRAVVGTLGPAELQRSDQAGVSVSEAIRAFGLDVKALASAGLTSGTFAFVEVHIEQGPVLESIGVPLGVVTTMIGQTRLELSFRGRANHAGTTPMPLRQDALAAAAEWILIVERHARDLPGLVATVGTISVAPGAANVVPGLAVLSLDVRHAEDDVREQAVIGLVGAAERAAAARGVQVTSRETSRQAAVAMDAGIVAAIAKATSECGLAVHQMVSGAGHDAMILAAEVPAGMLFVRTPEGLSHHPDEAVSEADVGAACAVFLRLLEDLDLDSAL